MSSVTGGLGAVSLGGSCAGTAPIAQTSGAMSATSSNWSAASSSPLPMARKQTRRHYSGSAYLVSGAALKAVNGVYTQNGESDGVPKYTYYGTSGAQYSLLRRSVAGERFWYIIEGADASFCLDSLGGGAGVADMQGRCFFRLCSQSGTPPIGVPWETATDGMLPGPFLTPIALTHAPPTSVLAPLSSCEVGDFVRANWAGRGVLYPGEVLAVNPEDDTLDVLYDDGDFESHVPRERVHPVSIELTDAFHSFGVGDIVKADLKGHGSWYTGRIIAIDMKFRVFVSARNRSSLILLPTSGCFLTALSAAEPPAPWSRFLQTLKYENGHLEKHVPPSRIQPMSTGHIKADYVHGERVRANWQSCGTWCLGRICAVNHIEGTFNVQYDDGEVELHVAAHALQPAEDAEFKALEAEPLPFACTLVSKASRLSPTLGDSIYANGVFGDSSLGNAYGGGALRDVSGGGNVGDAEG